ncbi:SAF domain-containing protein [Nocardioides sp. AE5]|uniref:SAF domain-containing protein n=1 Tax=Nocardioides sp. AE5 TaxID=2962573 RepID=UPI002881CA58|nr:SAF domain-containing protein [Nocardioides sp. AE5]MDT0201886.1 hypothetical protein [Nocardioides sp. AE5]
MSTNLGKTGVPAAQRARAHGWRDPRLWIGLALVAGSVLVGARLLGAADDTTQVWAVRTDLAAGQAVTADDLVAARVRFSDDDEDRYLSTSQALPDDAVLVRAVGAGELLPAGALATGAAQFVEVPLSAPAQDIPTTLARGSRIDVYVVPAPGGAPGDDSDASARKVLDDVLVVAAPEADDVLGNVGNRQVLVAVPAEEENAIGIVLAAAREGRIQIARRG